MARILVADDEANFQRYLALVLIEQGHEVVTASNGHEAITLGTERHPDVLVVDWRMHCECSGIDVCRALQVQVPNLKAIIISGFSSEQLQQEAREVQIFAFLEKPFLPDDLLDLIQEALVPSS